jgi:streptogramin lyase
MVSTFRRNRFRQQNPHHFRPTLEVLETRCVLSTFNTFALPTAGSAPSGIVDGPDGNLWFTEANADKIGRITPGGVVTEFAIPTPGSSPLSIVVGSDGNLWFTEVNGFQIGRITTTGVVTEFRLPTTGFKPISITAGPDGALWFTEMNANNPTTDLPSSQPPVFEPTTSHPILGGKIGRISTTGAVTEFTIPTGADPNGTPNGITTGPDGNLWFTERNSSDHPVIGRLTPGGAYSEFPVTNAIFSQSGSITVGPDGNLWFTVSGYSSYVGRISTTGTFSGFGNFATNFARGITVGPDGNLWLTNYDQQFGDPALITRVTPAGVVTQFPLPDAAGGAFGITADHNGNLWFTELVSGKIVEEVFGGATAASTQTVLSANPSPGVFGQPVTLTATVTSIVGIPTGTVTFSDRSTILGSATLDANGQAKLSVMLAAGGHDLSAQYVGNTTFASSTSTTLSEPVNPAPTVIAISASANPALVGQSVTFTATVSPVQPGIGTPSGTVTFIDSGNVVATVALDATGRASFSTSFTSANSHTIQAVYHGSQDFAASSQSLIEQVNATTGKVASITTLTASATTITVGQKVTFTATVKAASGTAIPTGLVTFFDGNVKLGTATLNAQGQAVFTFAFSTAGSHTIKAVYSGNEMFDPSSASLIENVKKPRTWWKR